MKIRMLGVLALAAIAATACKKSDSNETVTADTTAVPGTDTTTATVVTPTTDSVITTTTTETDTLQGEAHDSAHADSTKM